MALSLEQKALLQQAYDELLSKVEGWEIVTTRSYIDFHRDNSKQLVRDGMYSVANYKRRK
jgi:predicted HicB family RNase H-like nuclease